MRMDRYLRPILERIALLCTRAILRLPADDRPERQTVQVEGLPGEILADAERWQQYGFTGVPPEGAEALVLAVGGNRDHPAVVAVEDRRYRPKGLKKGEVCLYTLWNGAGGAHRVILQEGRKALVEAAGEIRLVCGGSEIVMTPTGIALRANMIDLN